MTTISNVANNNNNNKNNNQIMNLELMKVIENDKFLLNRFKNNKILLEIIKK